MTNPNPAYLLLSGAPDQPASEAHLLQASEIQSVTFTKALGKTIARVSFRNGAAQTFADRNALALLWWASQDSVSVKVSEGARAREVMEGA